MDLLHADAIFHSLTYIASPGITIKRMHVVVVNLFLRFTVVIYVRTSRLVSGSIILNGTRSMSLSTDLTHSNIVVIVSCDGLDITAFDEESYIIMVMEPAVQR
jgi:hypothetical protein